MNNRCRLKCFKEMRAVMKACCILHNVIADARGYKGTMQFICELVEHDDFDLNQEEVKSPKCRVEQASQWCVEF